MTKQRETELDLLRVIAQFFVVVMHTAPLEEIFLRTLTTYCVPVYVMISGRFYLDEKKSVSIRSVWERSISRLIFPLVFWSVFYQFLEIWLGKSTLNWKGALVQSLSGAHQMWFLYMIIGLYIITPILRKISLDRQIEHYFIVLSFFALLANSYLPYLPILGSGVSAILKNAHLSLPLGFTGYYFLGHYLKNTSLTPKKERIIYLIGLFSFAFTVYAEAKLPSLDGTVEYYAQYLKPNTMLTAVAIYTFFVKRVSNISFDEKSAKTLERMSERAFGVYLFHFIFVELYDRLPWNGIREIPILGSVLLSLLTYILSDFCVFLIRKIPYIGKKIT